MPSVFDGPAAAATFTASQRATFLRTVAALHIARRVTAPVELLSKVMLSLATDANLAADRGGGGARARAEGELLLVQLLKLSAAEGGVPPALAGALLLERERAALWKPVALLHLEHGRLAAALRAYVADDEYVAVAVDFAFDRLVDEAPALPPSAAEAQAELRAEIMRALPRLHAADPGGAARLLLRAFPGAHERLLPQLDALPELQFLYLQVLLELTPQYERRRPLPEQVEGALAAAGSGGRLSEETHEHYLSLLCRFAPHRVHEYLQEHDTYRVDVCLELVEAHGIRDATAFLKERAGDMGGALELILTALDRAFEALLSDGDDDGARRRRRRRRCRALAYAAAGATGADAGGGTEPVEAMVSRAANLCQRNGATREDVERLWLRLLDCLLRWQRRLRQEGEPTVGEESLFPRGPASPAARQNGVSAAREGEVQQLLGRLVRLVLGRMSSQMRLEAVLRHVLDAHTTEALGHFRATIADVFETCRFQTATLEHVTALAKREVHELSEECQREALRGCVHDARPDGGAPRRPTEEYGARAIRAQQAITQATMPDDVRRARLAALATPGAVLHGRPPVRPSIEAPSLSALLGGHGYGAALAEL